MEGGHPRWTISLNGKVKSGQKGQNGRGVSKEDSLSIRTQQTLKDHRGGTSKGPQERSKRGGTWKRVYKVLKEKTIKAIGNPIRGQITKGLPPRSQKWSTPMDGTNPWNGGGRVRTWVSTQAIRRNQPQEGMRP